MENTPGEHRAEYNQRWNSLRAVQDRTRRVINIILAVDGSMGRNVTLQQSSGQRVRNTMLTLKIMSTD